MKIRLVFILSAIFFSIFIISCKEKPFQGIITYDMNYIDESGQMNKQQVDEYIGKSQTYFFKEGKYKSVMNGLLELTLFYTGKDTLYNTMNENNSVMYINTKERNEKLISAIIKESEEVILGYKCDVLEVVTSDGTMMFYFNKSLSVNKNLYKNHKKGFWDLCLEKTNGALPLKWVTNTSGLKLTIMANKIKFKALEDSIFEIPKGLPIIKGNVPN